MKKILFIFVCLCTLASCSQDDDVITNEPVSQLSNQTMIDTNDDLSLRAGSPGTLDILLEKVTSSDGWDTYVMPNKYQCSITGPAQCITLHFSTPNGGELSFPGGPRFAIVSIDKGNKCGTPIINGKTVSFNASDNFGSNYTNRLLNLTLQNTLTGGIQCFYVYQSTNLNL